MARENVRPRRARPTIGFVSILGDHEIVNLGTFAIANAAREQGVNVILFPAQALRDPRRFIAQANVLYDLMGAEALDGLIFWSLDLEYAVGEAEFRKYCERYLPLPIVDFGKVAWGDWPGARIDNYYGMREVIAHLIDVHGYRRIAFIRGSQGHEGMEDRYRAYCDVLTEHGLPIEPDLVSPYTREWTVEEGAAMVRLLLDERRVRPDAVAATVDDLGLGAMRALQARGMRVPQEIAVTGFNSLLVGQSATPPLTSAQGDWDGIARQAVAMMLSKIQGRPLPEATVVPARLVVHESCGCLPQSVIQAAAGSHLQESVDWETALSAHREELLDIVAGVKTAPGAEAILDTFAADVKSDTPSRFLPALNQALQQTVKLGDNVSEWQTALSAMRRRLRPYFARDPLALMRAEDLWGQARMMIGETVRRVQLERQMQDAAEGYKLTRIGQELLTAADLSQLFDMTAQELPSLRIPSCYLSLYEDPAAPAEWARLAMAYDSRGRIELPVGGQRFPSRQLVPGDWMPEDRPYSFVVQPLYYRDEQIGFGVFELGPQQASLYQSLQGLFSSALKEIQLVEQMRQRAIQLQTAAEVSQASSSLLDPNQLIQQTVDLIRERFQLYYAGLFLVDKTGEWAVLQSGTGEAGQIMLARNHKLQVGGTSMIGWCIANQSARIALDVGQEAVRFGNPLLPETRSELALPLISRGQVIGALTIQSTLVRAFSAEDIATFQTMADQLANAIANARLFEQSQEALREVQTVQRRYLERAWTDYLTKSQVTAYETVRPGAQSLGDATLPEIEQAMERQGATILTGDGEQGHSAIVVPLTMRGAAIGALGIHDESGARQWTEDEIALVESVAERMALAAENLRLLDDTQRRASREQLLGAVTAHMRESLDVERVLQTAVREFGESLGAAEVSIRLTPDDGQTVARD